MNFHDTIIALSTAPSGAIAVIRLSGNKAIQITDQIFQAKKSLQSTDSNQIVFGKIVYQNEVIDEVLVSIFRNPHSYTGEDLVEISCHGSQYIISQIIHLSNQLGARNANPGEFTQRAFLNGKMDLTQAEAVADLIASDNKASHQISISQLRGGISSELKDLREELVNFTALIELELDFGEEDVEFADRTKLNQLIEILDEKISKLITSFQYGNAIKEGIPVAIIGPPNAGKSSLLNVLLNDDRAIVSDIAGTTRDTIEEKIIIDGINFRLIDTAGIRESSDTIESIGIEKSRQTIEKAKLILSVYDCTQDDKILIEDEDKWVIYLANKMDLSPTHPQLSNTIYISTKSNQGIGDLKSTMLHYVQNLNHDNSVIISNSRHYDALKSAQLSLIQVKTGLNNHISGDLLSPHLRECLKHIGDITGQIDIDKDILGTIFGKFCIGK